jgi:F-box and leucine-rich repeat protein 2/20
MAELAEGCPKLKEISLSQCTKITDVGLTHLVKGCMNLETCNMVYCPLITTSGLATLISSCAKIKKVLIEDWKVSDRTRRRAGSVLTSLCCEL